ncbi:mucin-5AC-like [Anopheles funestus]|uniref:mucin-5AC-like n=1 Tax=Anopheles funestus TaxID=62324 RepID=UPI0020C5E199|nr:mucin-5AC-like [Anopheles funestus]XP_049281955.1 mucin-5AC-like [Anopheles funestus]XP_049281956.1 mucin-5AC-like [Anopheles funestus]XP_049281957.1 mucin-5AC-like [Anopheles funestus]
MHMLDLITDIAMASSSSQMEISEPFRTEDLSKTDFFDFVTGSAPDMAISSSSGGPGGGGGGGAGGGGGGGASVATNSTNTNGNNACNRTMSGVLPSMGPNGVTDRPPDGRNGSESSPMDGTPTNRVTGTGAGTVPDANDQPLQGFDQFWGPDKDANRLDPAMFEDLNRYCWIQQTNNTTTTGNNNTNNNATNNSSSNNNNGTLSSQVADTDGQIYTLTVLNGAPEPWVLRKDPNSSEPAAPASNLDLDTILGGFPGYVKTECFSYDDSGFGTDHHAKDDPHHQQQHQHQQQQHQHLHLVQQQQQQHAAHHAQTQPQLQQVQPQQQQMPVTSSNIVLSSQLLDPNSVLAYQNNNNDWQMSDHNVIQQDTPESLLRSALQGKGYTKGTGLPLPNGAITVLPATGHMKDDELRRVLYSAGDPTDSLAAYADSTLASTMYDESVLHSPASTNQSATSQHQHQQQQQMVASTGQVTDLGASAGPGTGPGSVVVDDMFLTLDAAFPEDYEKLKRIATEVQQFCTDNNNYTEIIVEAPAIGNGCNSSVTPSNLLTGGNLSHHPGQHGNMGVMSPTGASGLTRQPSVSTTTSSDVVTTTSTSKAKAPRTKKNYKRSLSNNAATAQANSSNSPTLTCLTTNNNNTSMSNLNTITGGTAMLSPGSVTGSNGTTLLSTTSTSTTTTTTATTSPTQCGNGQRKERSLHYCSICSKGFKDKYSVNVHIRTHTGEKPFACSLCGKSFRQKAHLAKHYQTHLAQKNPPGGGTVTKQSKQSRLTTSMTTTDPSAGGQLPSAPGAGPTVTPVSLAVTNVPGPHPQMVIAQAQSPPMLLTNTNTATIVASR